MSPNRQVYSRELVEELVRVIAAEVMGHLGNASTIAKLRRRAAALGLPESAADFVMRRWVTKIFDRFHQEGPRSLAPPSGPVSGPSSLRIVLCQPCVAETHEGCGGGACSCACRFTAS